ncbi:MAG TPA: tRNA (adenosine(37)-N6)-threonylcarbamoyltransferase complex ATPase subunit type 1 TsaE [Clostridiales bacterium]|nr:tRNA (adenosine(37)-N6)-threonylcarbamoyltransferase complex ATPase subunit type 1 TsaE [Clostridiales bacterium]
MIEYISRNADDTNAIGIAIGTVARPGLIITLNGDLGVGKTVLARGIGRGLGVDAPITSPTFTILHQYKGRLPFYHFDMYRLSDEEEIFELGFEDFIYGDGVSVIEWPENMGVYHPDKYVQIDIERIDDNTRKIIINVIGDEFKWLEERLQKYVSTCN